MFLFLFVIFIFGFGLYLSIICISFGFLRYIVSFNGDWKLFVFLLRLVCLLVLMNCCKFLVLFVEIMVYILILFLFLVFDFFEKLGICNVIFFWWVFMIDERKMYRFYFVVFDLSFFGIDIFFINFLFKYFWYKIGKL